MNEASLPVFIIHVAANKARKRHMDRQLEGLCMPVIWITDGDKETLTPEVLDTMLGGAVGTVSNAASCAYKHILAYRTMAERGYRQAIIFEDDIFLEKNFATILKQLLEEIQNTSLHHYLVSLEDSSLTYVKGSERKRQQLLYRKPHGRMAAAYLIDLAAAQSMYREVRQHKCNQPIDWFHNYCSDQQIIQIYWLHPTIATQGSFNGSMKSTLDYKPGNLWRKIIFKTEKAYKKLLWRLR